MKVAHPQPFAGLLKTTFTPTKSNVHCNLATVISISPPSYLSLPPPNAPGWSSHNLSGDVPADQHLYIHQQTNPFQ
ncbi:hypothetical protein PAXRUDRAFT_831508 [Paxillus rubicundulus Ve08.2h10]|uniref:Uncharacterized protein n=1 Tax=Paxillus rubicundulus Ve08.2h10 TaxID=930991 RepID=A0A0D0DI74_9AGAM|nr:hypothetical protein PAXRUDRAFT_831508 [Paxillus rubicundulus Ve08.2h10]